MRLEVDCLPQIKDLSVEKVITKASDMDLREIDLIKSQTDSIAITNFDNDKNQINQVEMQFDPLISTDDTIPNEDFNEKISAYVLPEKQISIRKLSVNRQESERGRQAGQSCGPKLRFDNKIE